MSVLENLVRMYSSILHFRKRHQTGKGYPNIHLGLKDN